MQKETKLESEKLTYFEVASVKNTNYYDNHTIDCNRHCIVNGVIL